MQIFDYSLGTFFLGPRTLYVYFRVFTCTGFSFKSNAITLPEAISSCQWSRRGYPSRLLILLRYRPVLQAKCQPCLLATMRQSTAVVVGIVVRENYLPGY